VKNFARSVAACILLVGTSFSSLTHAEESCKEMDQEDIIAELVTEHEGGKVLKVEESVDAEGCVELIVRILIDGTVKAITIPNETGA